MKKYLKHTEGVGEVHVESQHNIKAMRDSPTTHGILSLSCHRSMLPERAVSRAGECAILLPTHAAAVFIDRSRAPGSCESLSAFFPTLASANSSEDSPIGRGADR